MSYPPLAVKFLSFSLDSSVVIYTVSITDFSSKETFLIQSRYSLLLDLHQHLLNYKFPLPLFPPKKCCFHKEPSFLSQRQKALENYFNTLLKNANPLIINDLKIFFLSLRSSCSLPPLPSISPSNSPSRKLASELPIKSLFFKGIIDAAIQKFVDMNPNLCAPDEDEINKKKEEILKNRDKFIVQSSKMLGELKLPKIPNRKCENSSENETASKDVSERTETNINLIGNDSGSSNETMEKIEVKKEKFENNHIKKFEPNSNREREEEGQALEKAQKKKHTGKVDKNENKDCEQMKNEYKSVFDFSEAFPKYEIVGVLNEMDEIVKNIQKFMSFIVEKGEFVERAD